MASLFSKKKSTKKTALPSESKEQKQLKTILAKLKAHEDFKQEDEELLKENCKFFANSHDFQEYCFSVSDLLRYNEQTEIGARDGEQKKDWWRVKLILTSMTLSPLAKVLGRFTHETGVHKWKYGMVHAALQIGHVVVEWNRNSLCIPTDVSNFGESALIAIDLVDGLKDKKVQIDAVIKACDIIVDYNINKYYDVIKCNCQHFVDDVLKAIGITPVFSGGVIGQFFTHLQSCNSFENFEFRYPPKGNGTLFPSHEELDEFYLNNKNTLDADAVQLIKAYDRVFWYRFYAIQGAQGGANRTQEEKNLILKYRPCESGCPFDDPQQTGTLAQS